MSDIKQETDLSGVVQVKRATSLKHEIDLLITKDDRFKGLAKYMEHLVFFWTRQIPTACAGHGFIFFNPDFYDKLPKDTRPTIIAHEVWHLILKHLERGETFEPNYYNIAADHVINLMLEGEGFTFEGTDPCKDPIHANKSTEQIYYDIYVNKKPEERPQFKPGSIPSPDKIKELVGEALKEQGGAGTDKEVVKQQDKNDQQIKRSIQPGNLPGGTPIQLEINRNRMVVKGATYREVFAKYFIDPLGGGKRSFMRPNRRQIKNSKLRLPGRLKRKGEKNRLTHLIYALDVSGSINNVQKQQFHDSVRTIKETLHPRKLTVLFFNTRIVLEKTFEDTEPYGRIKVNGNGGTCLNDVYRRAAELNAEALVIFTDLCVVVPPQPAHDVIWLLTERHRAPDADMYGDIYQIPEAQ